MDLKLEAARYALDFIQDGMRLGLGSGSTTAYFLNLLAEQIRSGAFKDVVGIPTSEYTAQEARRLGIPLTTLSQLPETCLDLAIDGADEIDPDLNLIKGLGRALLREKILEIHAQKFIIIADESKLVPRLGRGPLPVEIVQFEADMQVRWLTSLGCRAELWREENGSPVVTDNANYLVRCWFPDGIENPYQLARTLADRPGIVEHGLFLGMASLAIVATNRGIKILEKK